MRVPLGGREPRKESNMKKNVFFKAGILLLSLLLLPGLAGCGAVSNVLLPTVSESDVFHTTDQIDAEYGGSRNVTVEQLPDGMRATGSERAAVIQVRSRSFSLGPDPEGAEFQAEILGFKIDSRTGEIYSIVVVHLGAGSSILAWAPNSPSFDSKMVGFLPGAPSSENISVRINSAVGYTEIAGLRFREEVTLNVWGNNIVELDRENVAVSDINGQQWVSKRVRIGERSAILLVKK